MIDLELRGRIAIACGWADIKESKGRLFGVNPNFDYAQFDSDIVPLYDQSIDAIAFEYDRKGFDFELIKYTHEGMQIYFAHCDRISVEYQPSGAIALCKLFLDLCDRP